MNKIQTILLSAGVVITTVSATVVSHSLTNNGPLPVEAQRDTGEVQLVRTPVAQTPLEEARQLAETYVGGRVVTAPHDLIGYSNGTTCSIDKGTPVIVAADIAHTTDNCFTSPSELSPARTLRSGQLTESQVGSRGLLGINEAGGSCEVSDEIVRFTEYGPKAYVSDSGCYVESF